MQYHNNSLGKYQEYLDNENRLNKLVRAHNLQTQGTSGYNIINGKPSTYVENLVPTESQGAFEQKLSKFYSKYKIGPGAES